ncbi:hypothetical protein DYBT9275_04900 [Dyadobacter sp. CECT 9275]|uniref:DUF3991 domain-containing protein n=1 Tax=Dyadobacter helix TaxID=2822344 RepID=A0A916JJK7_9BACT|nr:DUF3991 and TOPRIM domain-containing protein [Dyadobacter sp. CECT 9275]CAG5011179.1 hypothetical protein DYBT9275_04900 [Dyadobacter sp. CECT 9275]
MTHKNDFAFFKESINLGQYAAAQGYELDSRKSTRSSLVMRHNNGDKIIISRKADTWIYFSVRDNQDNGTIVDFIQRRTGKTLPEIAEHLAGWESHGQTLSHYNVPDVKEQVYDRQRILKAFQRMKPIITHPYLTDERKIPSQVLVNERFRGKIFQDYYGNVVFPHQDGQGICGLELKNHDKGVFMRGSEKALWLGAIEPSDTTLVLAESPIDALSHYTLFKPVNTAYAAVSGGMRDKQFEFLVSVIAKMPLLEQIVLAVDNDAGGNSIAERIEEFIGNKFTKRVIRHVPQEIGADWNQVLKMAL